jgi:hypothetical protein
MNRRTRLRLLLSRRDSFVRTIMMMTALSSGGVARFRASVKQWVKRPRQALLPKHLLSSTFVSFSFRFVIVSPRSRSIEQRTNNCDLRKRQEQPHMKRVVARHVRMSTSASCWIDLNRTRHTMRGPPWSRRNQMKKATSTPATRYVCHTGMCYRYDI